VRATLDRYATAEEVVTLAEGKRAAIHLALGPSSRQLQVQSFPPGAQLFVDGRLIGRTPLTAEVMEDDFHELRLEETGYESLLKALPPDDRSTALNLTLVPETHQRATIWIDANRASSVLIDGHDTGLLTPTLGIRVTPGRHVIELRDASGERGPSAQVRVQAGETKHLTLDFERAR
jgi:hypothetical protein